MTTYKTLYHLMVQNMSEAIDLYDAGKGILAREVLKKALLDAESVIDNESRRRDIPGRITSSLECVTDTPIGKA